MFDGSTIQPTSHHPLPFPSLCTRWSVASPQKATSEPSAPRRMLGVVMKWLLVRLVSDSQVPSFPRNILPPAALGLFENMVTLQSVVDHEFPDWHCYTLAVNPAIFRPIWHRAALCHGTSSNMALFKVVRASDAMAPNVRRIWNQWGSLEPICAVTRPTADES